MTSMVRLGLRIALLHAAVARNGVGVVVDESEVRPHGTLADPFMSRTTTSENCHDSEPS